MDIVIAIIDLTMFQHTAARRRLDFQAAWYQGGWIFKRHGIKAAVMFQHTAARRRLAVYQGRIALSIRFNTQPPEGGWAVKTAFLCRFRCFNTQPPEGGWSASPVEKQGRCGFNTQPPEGGWLGLS